MGPWLHNEKMTTEMMALMMISFISSYFYSLLVSLPFLPLLLCFLMAGIFVPSLSLSLSLCLFLSLRYRTVSFLTRCWLHSLYFFSRLCSLGLSWLESTWLFSVWIVVVVAVSVNNGQETRSTRTSFNSLYHSPSLPSGERDFEHWAQTCSALFTCPSTPFFHFFFICPVPVSCLFQSPFSWCAWSHAFLFLFTPFTRLLLLFFLRTPNACEMLLWRLPSPPSSRYVFFVPFYSFSFLLLVSSLFVPFKKIPERNYCNCREQGRSDALEDRR